MKKYLKIALINLGLIGAVLTLAACMEKSLTMSDNISTSLATVMTYFEESVLNKETETDFDVDTSASFITDENYYVLVATEVKMDITQIKLGEVTYEGGVDFPIAVGNSNVVTRTAYKVDGEQLFVSAPLLFLNAGNSEIVLLSFPEQAIMPLTIQVYQTGQNNVSVLVTSETENVLFSVNENANEFDFKSNNPNNQIFVVLKEGEITLSTTEKILVEKVANPSKGNQSKAYSYVTPTMPSGQTENGLEFFPGYNSGLSYTVTTPADHDLVYNIFVFGVGTVSLTIHFENTFTE